jgi:NAD(P)-dependent dehydrogenase (short-subunit alcohol dehydrogenase family)
MTEHVGHVALVTGASGGLGTAVTRSFRQAGFRVVAASGHVPAAAETGADYLPVAANLMVASEAKALVERALREFGRLDALVHLAGGFAGGHPIEETPDEEWDHMLNLNLRTAVNAIAAVLPSMRKAGWGRIVVVGSKAGLEPPAGLSAYAASKAALHAMVRVVAEETRMAGITVNAVLPSIIDTPVNRRTMMDADTSKWVKPEGIASLALWLCSDAAADVNGALVPVYGRV